jgi:pyruvate, water dikinase
MGLKWFRDLDKGKIEEVGVKAAYLADLFNNEFPVSNGFVITTEALKEFLSANGLDKEIKTLLKSLDFKSLEMVSGVVNEIKNLIEEEDFSPSLKNEILESYENLNVDSELLKAGGDVLGLIKSGRGKALVAVRASGVYDTPGGGVNLLNIVGLGNLLNSIKECWAGLFSVENLSLNKDKILDEDFSLGVVIQKMVDTSKSGVVLSSNPMNRDKEMIVEAGFGLGKLISQGEITPDVYIVDNNLNVKKEKIGRKKLKLIRDVNNNETVRKKLLEEEQDKKVLESFELDEIVKLTEEVERHYGKPVVLEFGFGKRLEIFHVRLFNLPDVIDKEDLRGEMLVEGKGGSGKVNSGVVGDEIQVDNSTNSELFFKLENLKGVVMNEGSLGSGIGILCRERGIPFVVAENATALLNKGLLVTVDGREGKVYNGDVRRIEIVG